MQKQEQTTLTPGVWTAIVSGFDLTAKNLWLVILPVALDLFFWLGPRLHFQTLIEEMVAALPQEAALLELAAPLLELAPRTNLFTVLSVPLIGLPTLMATLSPETIPLAPTAVEVESWGLWAALFVMFLVVGLLLTALYYVMIAAVVSPPLLARDWRTWAGETGTAWKRLLGLALFFIGLAFIIYLPVSLVGGVAFMIAAPIGTFILLLAPLVLIWVAVYLSVTPQIIVLDDRPVLSAVRESMRFVQKNLLPLLLLLLLILLAGTVVDWLLVMAENGSWLTIINIAGHAFVSTALVTALFVFYRDRTAVAEEPG